MNKNIGDMTESELKDFIIELQEENSRYEREIKNLEVLVECLKLGVTLNKEQEKLLDKILFE